MADVPRKPATYEDIEAVAPHLVAEIIDGVLRTHPRPSPRHAFSASSLVDELISPFQKGRGGPGGWVFAAEPELHMGNDVLVPDIAGWRRQRMSTVPAAAFFEIAPDWVCEVLSGSTEKRDRTIKMKAYATHGISYFWLIDPRQQMLEAYELVNDQWVWIGGWSSEEDVHAPPFEALKISLADLWPLDPPLGFNEDPTPYYAGDR